MSTAESNGSVVIKLPAESGFRESIRSRAAAPSGSNAVIWCVAVSKMSLESVTTQNTTHHEQVHLAYRDHILCLERPRSRASK